MGMNTMSPDLGFIMAGALVGLCVGLTGVGGGSLMTPLLTMLGVPLPTAIGTDLLYAAITKSSGAVVHFQKKNIEWSVVRWLASPETSLARCRRQRKQQHAEPWCVWSSLAREPATLDAEPRCLICVEEAKTWTRS